METKPRRPPSPALMNAFKKVSYGKIKQIGASGQTFPGKEFADRTVVIDSNEPGIWVIKTAQTIPDGELWLHQAAAAERLDRALTCLTPP